jgi:hypothetical protein
MVGCWSREEKAARSGDNASISEHDTWEVLTIRGERAGCLYTRVRYEDRSGEQVLRIIGEQRLAVRRFGTLAEQRFQFASIEKPTGELLEFDWALHQGSAPQTVFGRVSGERLELTSTSHGKSERTTIPWSAEYGGIYFLQQGALLRQPLRAGERRTLRGLVPPVAQLATVELTAREFEMVSLPGGSYELLRVESVTIFPDGSRLPSVLWCDRAGNARKVRFEALNMESYRTTEADALQQRAPPRFDMGWDVQVRLARPIPKAHETSRIRYRVTLSGGDPAAAFVSGPSQQVKARDPHTAEITVYALRPGRTGNPNAREGPPTAEDLGANTMIQSDDPRVIAHARQAAGEETDPWKTAVLLERYVHRAMRGASFSLGFATAAEVAENLHGDCTEYAVFLAALCRARKIPARVALGLVYVEADQALAFHMWNEVYVDKQWIPLDATLGRGGIGAAHLKIAHSNLHGGAAHTAAMPVLEIVNRLSVAVEEVVPAVSTTGVDASEAATKSTKRQEAQPQRKRRKTRTVAVG